MARSHAAPSSPHTGRLVGHGESFEMPSYRPEPWTREAACLPERYPSGRLTANSGRVPLKPDDWHQPAKSPRTPMARSVCNLDCPVRTECLQYAVRKRIVDGIWGGVTEKELRSLVLTAQKQAKAERLEREAAS